MEDTKVKEEYKKQIAYKQVSAVLDCYKEDLLSLVIPQDILDNIKNNAAKDYEFDIDPSNFDPSILTDEALELLFILFYEYISDEKQKQKINSYFNPINNEHFDQDELFSLAKKRMNHDTINQTENQLVVYSEDNIIKKIINRIKQLFTR